MEASVLTYSGGLNKDLSVLHYPNDKYYDAINFRINTSEGLSTSALENEKGNRLDFQIPSLPATYKIKKLSIDNGVNYNISGNGYSSSFIGNTNNINLTYNQIISNPVLGPRVGIDFNLYLQDDYIYIVPYDLNFTITQTSNLSNNTLEEIVNAANSENLRIIHLNYIDNNIVVFTTTNNLDGQIWYVPYNEETNLPENLNNGFLIPSIHLKYNHLLNLSTEITINKSIIRKENSKTCRIYWTDNNNPTRKFNLLDSLQGGLNPEDLDLNPNVTLSKPIITDISDNGNIPFGACVQFGYILVSSSNETKISPLSDVLPIYGADDETSSFVNIKGNDYQAGEGKAVTYKILDVDTDYDIIKHVAILYELKNTPLIQVFKTENIISNEITVTYTNTEQSSTITEFELNDLKAQWSICKSITSQNNRLIAANTKSVSFEVPDTLFDSRVYRYNSSSIAKVKDKLGNITTINSTFDLPEEHDAINPFNNIDDPDYDLYKYQSDGITLGGTGKNISYKFITQNITVDPGITTSPTSAPFANSGQQRTTIIEGEYSFNNQYNHFKSPFIHFLYPGYTRDEIYRFGIVFYNKKAQPSFVKWIGDIKFPTIQEIELEVVNGLRLNARQLGIEFDITIPDELKEQISGYEIVRVNRDIANRTIISGGLFEPLMKYTSENDPSEVSGANEFNRPDNMFLNIFSGSYTYFNASDVLGFISPQHLFFGIDYKSGDYITFEQFATPTTSEFDPVGVYNDFVSNTGIDYRRVRRKQNYSNIQPLTLKSSGTVGVGNSFDIGNLTSTYSGFTYNNELPSGQDDGGPKLLLATNSPISNFIQSVDTSIHYLNYRRKLIKQYGGNSFEERSLNTYISTSSYQNTNESLVIKVYGGDTFCNYFGYRYLQNEGDKARAIYFVCESPFNVDLRFGAYFNDTDPLTYSFEEYKINPVYLQENNIIQYFKAKPFNFNPLEEQPYAVWVSEKKINGEKIDSWSIFKINNQIEVDGDHGQINHITSFKDRLYFFQDQAIGLLPIEQQAVTTDDSGVELLLGTGDVIGKYGYVSTKVGCFHHDAIVQSEDYLYSFDIRTKKLWRFTPGSKEPLTDIKGLSSYFYNNIYNTLLENTDQKTGLIPIGVHGAYDQRYNRVLFTFNGTKNASFTISYNEFLDAFESFYTYYPSVYLSTGRKLFSVNGKPFSQRNKLYQHNLNNYCVFYDEDPSISEITYLVNNQNPFTKVFTNLEWYSECYDQFNNDVPDETFEFISVFNEHQSTGSINLQTPQIRRRFRKWRHSILRDINSPQSQARIRNPYVFIKLTKENTNNTRFIIHDLISYYYK